jgi:hypothetical protein
MILSCKNHDSIFVRISDDSKMDGRDKVEDELLCIISLSSSEADQDRLLAGLTSFVKQLLTNVSLSL